MPRASATKQIPNTPKKFSGLVLEVNGTFTNQGVIAPANSPGTLAIDGDIANSDSATLSIEIAGTPRGSGHDQLLIDGTFHADVMLQVELLDGFVPSPDNTFTILSADSVNGVFDNAPEMITFPGGSFAVDYGPDSVELGQFIVPNVAGDLNGDGVVDGLDIDPFVQTLTGTDAAQAVPEPTSAALLGLSVLIFWQRRRISCVTRNS